LVNINVIGPQTPISDCHADFREAAQGESL
jgi:hypothetical protein